MDDPATVFVDTETSGLGPDAEICDIAIVGHDTEHFFREVEEFGLWLPDLVQAAETFRQQRFPFVEVTPQPAPPDGPSPTERIAGMMGRGADQAIRLIGAPS